MLVKCREHLHPLLKLDNNFINQDIFKQDCSLDILEQVASTNKPIKKLVKELLIFKRYRLNVKDVKCLLWWW